MAWLDGWSKRYKITIDKDKIDEDLTDFPVYLTLSSGVGLNTFDTLDIFDEITPMNSGTVFSEDFTDGSKWSLLAGTVSYAAGTAQLTSANSVIMTTSGMDFGEYYETLFRFRYDYRSGTSAYCQVFLCYDDSTNNYQAMVEFYSNSSASGATYNYFRIYKKYGASSDVVYTDTNNYLYNYYNEYQQWFWVRTRREGDRARFKWWKTSQTEPQHWLVDLPSVFNSYYPTTGKIRFYCNTATAQLDAISVRTFPADGEKKIAMTASDGLTQLPVEIGYWDRYYQSQNFPTTPAVGYLWTKIPTVTSGEDTVFYLYYDGSQTENVSNVGYTDSTPAMQVWDSNFKFVGHMSTHPMYGYLKDSTSYNVDSATFTPDYNNHIHSRPGTRYIFNNSESDRITFSTNNAVTNISGALTVEAIAYLYSGNATNSRGIARKGTDYLTTKKAWSLDFLGAGPFGVRAEISDTGSHVAGYSCYSPASYSLNTRYHTVLRFIPSVETVVKINDSVAIQNTSSVPASLYVSGSPAAGDELEIGCIYRNDTTTHMFDGEIYEVRISDVARSDAWLKATYYSNTDQLLFYEAQGAPSYYYQGYVKEKGTAAQRTVRLYLRDTGELMDEVVSASGTGYYYLTTTVSGEHFVVAFDDDAGDEYNALILDRLNPTGIE